MERLFILGTDTGNSMTNQRGGIEFTLIVVIAAVIVVGAGLLRLQYKAKQDGIQQCKAEVAQAEQVAQDKGAALEKEAEHHIIDMQAAYDAGEYNAKQEFNATAKKGASDVQKYAVFANAACTLPDASVDNLNSQRRGAFGLRSDSDSTRPSVRTTSAPSGAPAAVPSPGLDQGRPDSNAVPGSNQHHRPLGAVQPQAQPVSPTREIPR